MKTRTGFVSNSSSSSFIIHKCNLNGNQITELNKWWEENEDKIGDDGGPYMEEVKNYIFIRCHSHKKGLFELLNKIGIDKDDIYYIYL